MSSRVDQGREHTRMQAIATASCRDLLARHSYGRIAWQAAHGLQILPVSYAWHDESIVFRTSPEGSLSELIRPCPVVFEVDELDEARRSGWSVVVHGRARAVADPPGWLTCGRSTAPSPGPAGCATSSSPSTPTALPGARSPNES